LGANGSSDKTTPESSTEQKQEAQQSAEEVLSVEASSFVSEFDKNQLAAEEKYEGKQIKVTAYIDNISEDITGTLFLILQPTADEYYVGTSIQCFFKDKSELTSLENGQKVTVQGRVDTQLMNVLVKDCKVLKGVQ